jgi:hypothetical protein
MVIIIASTYLRAMGTYNLPCDVYLRVVSYTITGVYMTYKKICKRFRLMPGRTAGRQNMFRPHDNRGNISESSAVLTEIV